MGIQFDKSNKIFKLDTQNTTYMMGMSEEGYLGHIYYGKKLERSGGKYLLRMEEAPYTPSSNFRDKSSFLDFFPSEYPTGGVGDYRESCLNIRNENGCMGCELLYHTFDIFKGKPALKGLPASFGTEKEVVTLQIICVDDVLNLRVELFYSVFNDSDVITRSVRVSNEGQKTLKIEKVYSACLDLENQEYEMISLHGSWARERHIQRSKVNYGKQLVSSTKGEPGHQEHPFIALVKPETNQENGEVYGMHFVYSGNFIGQAERTQFDFIRMIMGIHSDEFTWNLKPGESFQTPEVVMTYSSEGLGKMTRCLHDFYRNHMIRSPYKHKKRPVLINNWEATYYDFNSDKLLAIAKEAKKAGIEMLVMDDGWFGERNSDNGSLGDWTVNTNKITSGLKDLVERVNQIGLDFGIWFEPEMVSPNSNLYREHPEWAIQIKGRETTQSRGQYVLDLSNPEVVDYAYECVAKILRSAPISYVKWDMNRQLCNLGSSYLTRESQQELFHKYVLGVYEMQERLITEFPYLLLENCSGGGARFDPGMLYYSPQIWCSDDTDAVERLKIQEGTAMIYPLSAIGAHVSDCPNHSVGRITPFMTRGHVALAGSFGYELDITKISKEDKDMIPKQVEMYHKYHDLVSEGDYYRISSWSENHCYDCWSVVSKNKQEVLVTYVQVLGAPNSHSRRILLKGLDLNADYSLEGTEEIYTGELLVNAGFLVRSIWGDYQSRLYHFIRLD
ncbi:alpha-galactosidase [Anaerosacchariphilus polymeriproducens]|uniref:Alpha-galactosidase n=1 Tax=Anaerosacchariphilus polymeriproducens TaxID=1812858 RepID=A0A371AR71_9FIRM|nr:alpha-galactosidase [Anaerosacchariphilus polymeriproducens]RDU22069.1 alpha-galactosidase [Anaerosacchariphilus polymeriproducens]